MASIRRQLITRVREFWTERSGQRYFVKRGVINWAGFDFKSRPFAIAILIDDMSIRREINGMNLTFEIATSMPTNQEFPEIDDGLLDDLIDDCESFIDEIRGWTDSKGDTLALRVQFSLARVVEFHDSNKQVQGIVLTIPVEY